MKLILSAMVISLLMSCGAVDHLSKKCGNGAGCQFVFGSNDKKQDKEIEKGKEVDSSLQEQINQINAKLQLIDLKIANLEAQDLIIISRLDAHDSALQALEDADDALQALVDALSTSLTTTIGRVSTLESSATSLQAQVDALVAQMAAQGLVNADLQAQIDALNTRLSAVEAADYQGQINNIVNNLINSLDSRISALETNTFQAQINALVVQLAGLTFTVSQTIVAYLDPCNDGPGYDEVLLKTGEGKVIAYFENGNNRHLTVLVPNTLYSTTDSQACLFKVDTNGNLIY